MLNSFWSSKRDAGEVTPKASSHPERNPFELSLSNGARGPHSRKNSTASNASNAGSTAGGGGSGIPSGLRTPTLQKSFVLPEVTSSINAHGSQSHPSTSATTSLHQSPVHTVSGSGRNTPIRSHHGAVPYPVPPSPKQPPPSSALSRPPQSASSSSAEQKLPDFKLSQPPSNESLKHTSASTASSASSSAPSISSKSSSTPSSSSSKPSTTVSISSSSSTSTNKISPTTSNAPPPTKKRTDTSYLKGKLTVKIMEARGLSAPSADCRPYVVATFEQNEFVSREAINEHEEDALGVAMSPESSSQLRKTARTQGNGAGQQKEEQMDTSTASAYNPVWKHEVAFDVTQDVSPVYVCVYDRTTEEEAFLGLVDIEPKLQHGWNIDEWYPLHARQDEPVTGEVRVRMRFERSEARRTLRAGDFEFLRMIGKGTFGRVFQVRKKDTKRIYAMKVLSKREIIAKKEVQHTIGERKILQRSSDCPFLLGLKFSFQSSTELFLCMDFKSGGELFHHLQREGRFTEDRARFYAAEITLAFEYLHKYNIVYRDLKPENILLDATGHIVLCDFGLSKPDLPSDALTNTFCGTTEYLAPEVLLDDHGYSQTVDFWSLGVLLFEMCCGWSPFYAEDTQQMYKNICFGKIKFPRGVIGDDGKQFVKGLLNRNPAHRLGSKRDAAELKEHPFFKMIDWEALAARQVTVPFKPSVDSDESVNNFDPEFTEADILKEAPVDNGNYYDDDPAIAWLDEPSTVPANGGSDKAAPVPINPSRNRMDGAGPGRLGSEAQNAFAGFSYSGDAELHDLMMQASMSEEKEDDMRA